MNFAEYSPLALRTAKQLTSEQNLRHAAILMISEAGEIADAIKAFAIYGKPLDRVNLLEEVGDLLWGLNLHITYSSTLNLSVVDEVFEGYALYPPVRITDSWSLVDLAILIGSRASALGLPLKAGGRPARVAVSSLCTALVLLLDYLDTTFEHALTTNIAKLAKRYGDKYSDYKAVSRDLEAERTVLEGKHAKAN
jgi:NTP pyrophosphatase (non-canonical NTP hydrolase)